MASYKVVITDFTVLETDLEAAVLHGSGLDINLVRLQITRPEDLIAQVADADGLILQFAQINRTVIQALKHCQVVSRYGIGVDTIDLAAAGEHGIVVANVPDFCIEEVSAQTIGFLIDLNRHIVSLHEYVRAGKWGRAPLGVPAPRRLSTQTLGIVGLGNIGRAVAARAASLGLKLLGYDPYVQQEQVRSLGIEKVGLEELLAGSDYVSLHCPLVEETRGLIGAAQFAMMRRTAYLINMARGAVVDQAALYQALTGGVIAGAALDVLEQEPPSPDDPLLALPNVTFTPHSAAWSAEALGQMRRDAAQNVVDKLQGRMPRSVVNRQWLKQ